MHEAKKNLLGFLGLCRKAGRLREKHVAVFFGLGQHLVLAVHALANKEV